MQKFIFERFFCPFKWVFYDWIARFYVGLPGHVFLITLFFILIIRRNFKIPSHELRRMGAGRGSSHLVTRTVNFFELSNFFSFDFFFQFFLKNFLIFLFKFSRFLKRPFFKSFLTFFFFSFLIFSLSFYSNHSHMISKVSMILSSAHSIVNSIKKQKKTEIRNENTRKKPQKCKGKIKTIMFIEFGSAFWRWKDVSVSLTGRVVCHFFPSGSFSLARSVLG